jgi:hypothetical protein
VSADRPGLDYLHTIANLAVIAFVMSLKFLDHPYHFAISLVASGCSYGDNYCLVHFVAGYYSG